MFELADGDRSFSLLGFYDDDAEFVEDVAARLNVEFARPFLAKLHRVTQRLVQYDVLQSRMQSTQKYYVGEPTKQRSYWLRPGKAELINRGQTEYTMTPEGEVRFLLRRAYPDPTDAD